MPSVATPDEFSPHTLAEFAEAELLVSGDNFLSSAELLNRFAAGRRPAEEDISFMLAEIETRLTRGGRFYPFGVSDGGLTIDRCVESNVYFFLLLMSLRKTPVRTDGELQRSDPLFDAIAREAFREQFGPEAESLVFAWPPRDGRPSTFPEAIAWAAEQIGISPPDRAIEDHPRDAGVDVIAWRSFGDGRAGFQIMLAQNTVQFEFAKKPRDVQPSRWRDWFGIRAEPTVGFAIPFSVEATDIWWDDVCIDVNLVLDRFRLLKALDGLDPTAWREWSRLCDFVDKELEALRSADTEEAYNPEVPRRRRTRRERSPSK